jgi:hypothetical protein
MTSSGTYTFNPALTFIITSMLRKLGVISEDEQPTAGQYADSAFAANAMIKEWQASGIHVWTEQEAILFLQNGQGRYLLGGASTDNSSDAYSWTQAQLQTSAVASATALALVSAAGIVSGQNIGVALDSGVTFWTTVNGAPAGNVVTLAAGLPSSASAQNFVMVYTARIIRPLKVPKARRYAFQGSLETPMTVMARQQYQDLPIKTTPGIPTQFFYSPQLGQGELYVWPVPNNASSAVRFTWYRPLQDFNTPANTGDFPQEWINTMIWCLARECGLDYDVPASRWQIVLSMAAEKLDMVQNWDRESEPIWFGMGYDETAR